VGFGGAFLVILRAGLEKVVALYGMPSEELYLIPHYRRTTVATQVTSTEEVNEPPLVSSAEGVEGHIAANPSSERQLELPPPCALTAEEALAQSTGWRELVEQLEAQIDPVYQYLLTLSAPGKTGQIELPISIDAYSKAAYRVGSGPLDVPEGYSAHGPVAFRYEVRGEHARHIGKVDCVVLDSSQQVVEVWARAEDTLRIFRENIHGRTVVRDELERLYSLNEQLIDALRADPACSAVLTDFVISKRGYPDLQWSDHAKLAYYDYRRFDLRGWAEQRGFSEEELFQAGFLERTVTETAVRYSERTKEVIFIPFKNDEQRIVLWRMRVLDPKNESKYLSAPLRRSDRYPESVHRELYQSELLKDVGGKSLIITEGELKCLVTTQLTGFATVGITGITQVTDLIIEAIIRAKPESITVILDRDPLAMGLARTDRLTDSERAAFMIASRLKSAGHPKVLIGTVPSLPFNDPSDPKAAQKVGLDDYLLAIKHGGGCPTGALVDILQNGREPDTWLGARGNDPLLQELLARIRRLGQLERHFRSHVNRSGKYPIDSLARCEAEASLDQVSSMVEMLKAARDRHLKEHYGGARRINQPPRKFAVLYGTKQTRSRSSLCLVTQDRRMIALGDSFFEQDIPSLRAVPPDIPGKRFEPKGEDFPHSMARLTKAYHHPKQHPEVVTLYRTGAAIFVPESRQEFWDRSNVTYEQFVRRVFAGWLARSFPTTQYHYEEGITLQRLHPTYSEIIATIPIAIFKDGYKPVQFNFLPFWNTQQYSERSGILSELSPEDKQRAVATDALLAALQTAHEMAAVRCGVRDPKLSRQLEKLGHIGEIIQDISGDRGQQEAASFLGNLGISRPVAQQFGAMHLSVIQQSDLVARLRSSGLINQARQSGLLRVPADGEFAEARFTGDVILFPEFDEARHCVGFSVLPTSSGDRMLTRFPPIPKVVYALDSVRSATSALTLTGKFFPRIMQDALKDKTVLIAPSELECLQVQSLVHAAARDDIVVLGIRELDSIAHSEYQKLAQSGAKRVIFIGNTAEDTSHAMRYARFALSEPELHAALFLRAHQGNKSGPIVSAISLRGALSEMAVDLAKEPQAAGAWIDNLLDCPSYHPNHRTLARLAFSELLADLEEAFAVRGADSTQALPFDLTQATEILRALYDDAGVGRSSLEEFLEFRYLAHVEQPFTRFAPGFERPLYRSGAHVVTEIPQQIVQDCLSRRHVLTKLKARFKAFGEGSSPAGVAVITAVDGEREGAEELEPRVIHDTLQRLITKEVFSSGQLCHAVTAILGKLYHTVTLSIAFGEHTVSAIGYGPSKKYAENQGVRSLYRKIRNAPDLCTIYDAEVLSFKDRGEFESRLQKRRCFTSLRHEVAALKGQGLLIDLVQGENTKVADKSGWKVPLEITIHDIKETFAYKGSTPEASLNMAAARAIIWLREMLDEKRERGEYSEPTTVARDLEDLAQLIKADLKKGNSATQTTGGVAPQELKDVSMEVSPPANGRKERKSVSHVCSWTLTVNGESVTETAVGTKKKLAERAVATKLLRWLEQRDPVQEILAWEEQRNATR